MIKKRKNAMLILLNLLIIFICVNLFYLKLSPFSVNNLESDYNDENISISNNFQKNIIVYFNSSTYDKSVVSAFKNYGGIVKSEWNNLFTSFSGFAGIISTEQNMTLFQNDFPDAQIENNEILETQMNYASIQTGAINSTWFINGFKGETNCSVAVLDTGINPTHEFFPNGYNPSDLNGNIVGWENLINNNPISDNNGHGTYVSSIISGTGTYFYNSTNPITVRINGNYTHT
ncbi:MAG: S8 family serine peptidase, partial [Candidatus Thorarchaeota archaeon]